jgi:ankyrin repeat protein
MKMQPVDHLVAAALDGDRATFDRLMSADPGLRTARNMFGVSALHAAQAAGRADIAAALEPEGGPGLHLAAELGRLDAVERALVDDPAAARAVDASGSTPLHGACYWGRVEVAHRLLAAGAEPSTPSRDRFLQITPLGAAVATTPGVPQPSDDEDVVLALVRLLLEHGAEPDHPRLDGMTPLHAAAWRGLGRVAQELLDAGADRSATATGGPHAGQTPADTALAQGHLVLAARLDGGLEVASPYG